MMEMFIAGIGTVSAVGCGLDSIRAALRGEIQPAIQMEEIRLRSRTISLPVYMANPTELQNFVAPSALRRMDRFSQMALLAGHLAMKDAQLQPADNSKMATVFGLGYGAVHASFEFEDSVLKFGDASPSPTIFSRSVSNAITSSVATHLKLEGPSFTITSLESTIAGVFAVAANLFISEMADFILIGLGDEYHPARGYATALMADSDFDALKPRAWDQCTYIPGEAFTCFLISKGQQHSRYGRVSAYMRDGASAQDLISGQERVILDACGDKARSSEYHRFKFAAEPQSYAHLFGAMPTGAALDLAVAALDTPPSHHTFCVSAIGPDQFHILGLHA